MRTFYFILKSILVVSCNLLTGGYCLAQNYGLGFYSHETHQDKRTTLDLSPGKDFCLSDNSEISFELSFSRNHNVYFGYILRIIANNERNIDIVYNPVEDQFSMVIGDKLCGISFNIPEASLYGKWNKITVRFDQAKSELMVVANGKTYVQKNVQISPPGCYKIVFGASRLESFETTDIPPMNIRNVMISDKGTLKYHWPLNEVEGTAAYDKIKNRMAAVSNPSWQTGLHLNWERNKSFTVNGMASVAYDARQELVYITAADTIYTYSPRTSEWTKSSIRGRINLNQGNRAFVHPHTGALYSYFPGSDTVLKYNTAAASWNGNFKAGEVTGYWHFNKMFSAHDTSLYVFGGYGYLLYKNEVQKYSFNKGSWSKIKYTGDFFTPRYLAGLGASAKGDTAYILGGYGNNSGQQILNPKNLYDMMRFTSRDKRFTKMFELNLSRKDFALANSLVIDELKGLYYGLIFPRNKYSSSLQLIRGSLKNASFEVLKRTIPYAFHDVHSFADLYYCKSTEKFVTVTLLRTENNQTVVNLFTLQGPPYFGTGKLIVRAQSRWWYYGIASAVLLAAGAIMYYSIRKRNTVAALQIRKVKSDRPADLPHVAAPQAQAVLQQHAASAANAGLHEAAASGANAGLHEPAATSANAGFQNESHSSEPQRFKNAILLFGDLQVFDATGNSITRQFTPLIKELFLLILLHSVKLGRGVSSDKLNEMFWFDKTEKSARNNRSVAIVKLKSLLDKLEHCRLSKDSGYWMIEIDYQHFYIDYHSYLHIVNNNHTIDDDGIQHLSGIVQRGNFLSASEYEWLDNFKSEISNDIINTYLKFLQMPEHHNDPEFLIRIASYILNIDPVNEEAMILKCRSFVALGKHSLAKATFENFSKVYKNMYDTVFSKDFHSVLEKTT
jgi:two-component SAPR family response regulator